MKPVYMINGFLESGKTQFIKYTLEQPYFQVRGKTLLIVCEEGEEEYDATALKNARTEMVVIEEEEDFTPDRLIELEKQYKPERIIVEYNGMWNFKNMKMPWHWKIEQQITNIDGSTFPTYYNNMRSLLAEMIRNSEMIIINRCDGLDEQLAVYKRNIKALNPKADIIFEDANGEVSTIFEDDLPFDLKSDPIEMDDMGYGIWYLDAMDHLERYEGKRIKFLAQVMIPDGAKGDYFVPGRSAMTCCAEDIAFLGYACMYDKAGELSNKQWVNVTAVVKKEFFKDYNQVGPVLYATEVTPAKAPKNELISFV